MKNKYKVMEIVNGRLMWSFDKDGYDTYEEAEDAMFNYSSDKFEQYVIVYYKTNEHTRPKRRDTFIVGLYFLRDTIWQCIFSQSRLLGPISDKLEITDKIYEYKEKRNSI